MKRISLLLWLLLAALLAACSREGDQDTTRISTEARLGASRESTQAASSIKTQAPSPVPSNESDAVYAKLREEMVQSGIIDWGVEDEDVIAAMRAVPRHAFVPEEYLDQAYENHPLPIGFGQTISQPYIVATMTEAINPSAGDRVLEIGTGSGYQAAVLAEIVDEVYTVEIIEELLERATETHQRLGYENITAKHADGYYGWEEFAPFDAIVVTAAPDHVPAPLVRQLKIGGRLIIPVGPVGGFQRLWLVTRINEDEVQTTDLGGVSFVPFTRDGD